MKTKLLGAAEPYKTVHWGAGVGPRTSRNVKLRGREHHKTLVWGTGQPDKTLLLVSALSAMGLNIEAEQLGRWGPTKGFCTRGQSHEYSRRGKGAKIDEGAAWRAWLLICPHNQQS